MAIRFLRPYFLLLIPVLIFLVIYTSRKIKKMYAFRRKLILILRNVLFILLSLSLAGTSIIWNARDTATIIAVDLSDSMKESIGLADDFIIKAIDEKPGKELLGVVGFGDNSQVESFISKNPVYNRVGEGIKGEHTNIENALTASMALLPENARKRVVLVTDGEENLGDSWKIASSLTERGIDFKVYSLKNDIKDEVAVESINVPRSLSLGEEFSVVVNIGSRVKTGAKLTLFNGREKVYEERVELQSGSNRFVFRDTASSGGFRSYRAVVEPDTDTILKNNEISTFTNIKDKPKVLVLQDTDGEADEVVKMLQASGMDYRLLSTGAAPTTLTELSTYKTVITCNVSAENLKDSFLNALDAYVKDFGGGFIATGGENSFALGGYFRTTLEKVLPVNMELKGKKEIPDMSMMLIIDKSGSMMDGHGGITNIDIAKEAAVRVLDSLRPNKDEIGVIAFDDTVYRVVERKKIDDINRIKGDIGTIRAGGGTSILPALDEGYADLKKSNAKLKHIILLTDGQAETTGYDELLKNIKNDGITVSTVAVGQSSDRALLEYIAKATGGRYYFTDETSNIPRIFAKETFMAAKAYLNNREFTPNISDSHSILSGVAENGLPKLLGYIGSSPKSTARVVLSSDEDDPILTVWQYGLGKTAAWNSDISGKWSSNYVSWDKNIKLWQNMINWTIENYESDNASVEAAIEGDTGNITFVDKDGKEELETVATIIMPDNTTKEIKLFPVSPGKYSASFEAKDTGSYMVNVKQTKGGEVVKSAITGLPVQYSPEYSINREGTALERLVQDAGGKYIQDPSEIFKGDIKDVTGQTDLTYPLLVLALLIFLMDIALRRLNLPLQAVEEKLLLIKGRLKKKERKPVMKTLEVKRSEPVPEKAEKQVSEKPKKKEKPAPENLDVGKLLKKKENKYR